MRRVMRLDESPKAFFELPPVLGQIEPCPVQRVLGRDDRIPRLAQMPVGRPFAPVDDELDEDVAEAVTLLIEAKRPKIA